MVRKSLIEQTQINAGGVSEGYALRAFLCEKSEGSSTWSVKGVLNKDGDGFDIAHPFAISGHWVTETGDVSGFRYIVEDLEGLEIGSRVILSESSGYYSINDEENPANPGNKMGVVVGYKNKSDVLSGTGLNIYVKWSNGKTNAYSPDDLVTVNETQKIVLEELSGKEVHMKQGHVEVIGVNISAVTNMALVRLLDTPIHGHNGDGFRVIIGEGYYYTPNVDTDLWFVSAEELIKQFSLQNEEDKETMERGAIKVGDMVHLSEHSRFYHGNRSGGMNPSARVGTVIMVRGNDSGIDVKWDSGLVNAYNEADLVKLDEKQKSIYDKAGARVLFGGEYGTIVGFGGCNLNSPIIMFHGEESVGHSGNNFRLFLSPQYSVHDIDGNIYFLSDHTAEMIEGMRVDKSDPDTGTIDLSDLFSHIAIQVDKDDGDEEDNRRLIFSPRQIEEAAMFLNLYSPLGKSSKEFEDHIYERIAQCYNGDWEDGFRSVLGYTIRVDSNLGLDYDGYHTMEVEVSVDPSIGVDPEMFQGTVDESGKVVVNFPQR